MELFMYVGTVVLLIASCILAAKNLYRGNMGWGGASVGFVLLNVVWLFVYVFDKVVNS